MAKKTSQNTMCYHPPEEKRHRGQLLASSFRYAHRRVFGGMARLYDDRIELTGWYVWGRYRRCILLDQVDCLEYHTLQDDANLTVFLDGGRVVSLYLQQAHQWRVLFESWKRRNLFTRTRLFEA